MKEIIDVMLKDINTENFSKRECVIYGFVAPMFFVSVLTVVAVIQTLI